MDDKPRIIFFTTRDETLRVDLSSIAYFEAEGNYTRMVSFNGIKTDVLMNLGTMEKLLINKYRSAPRTFVRIGKRFILNLNYVFKVNVLRQELVLTDQRTFMYVLSMSKEALKLVKELISPKLTTNNTAEK